MTKRDYIIATNLALIRAARSILREVASVEGVSEEWRQGFASIVGELGGLEKTLVSLSEIESEP